MGDGVRVWAVRLGGQDSEARGTLAISGADLTFTHDRHTKDASLPLKSIRRVRRPLGSPVIVVEWKAGEDLRRIAFYFAQPPPLEPGTPGRRRRHRRQSVRYLMHENAGRRDSVREWRKDILAAVRTAKSES
jgi:cytochrome P450